MSTELITQDQASAIIALDETARATHRAVAQAEASNSPMLRAIVISKGMNMLRKQLTEDLLSDIMALQGTQLGFRADKQYPVQVVRDVAIEATLRGFRMINNEINIIAGRLYVTKEGYERLLREWPGLSELEIELEVPEIEKEVGFVSGVARWKLNGRQCEIVRNKANGRDLRIMVKVNSGMGHDAVLGKAKARICRLICERLSGLAMPREDESDDQSDDADIVVPPLEDTITASAWGDHAAELIDLIDQCTDREQLESVYKNWKVYAGTELKQLQLVNALAAKASALGV